MDKPTVFFSHSSRDKDLLARIKKYLIEKTGGSVDIFLSSDGQSIPLGRNWVHKVQESLEKANIMFVFLSPNAMSSQWILFESGYAYAKGIKVVPVGINGIDLSALRPPISLLQGFNITSYGGVNNIIALINSEFRLSFKEDFDNNNFEEIFREGVQDDVKREGLDALVEEIIVSIGDEDLSGDRESALKTIEAFLTDSDILFYRGQFSTRAHGWSFRSVMPGGGHPGIEFRFVPELMDVTVPIIDGAIQKIISGNLAKINVFVSFLDNVAGEGNINKISARLYQDKVGLGSDDEHIYNDMNFSVSAVYNAGKMALRIWKKSNSISSFDIDDLVEMLFNCQVLAKYDS